MMQAKETFIDKCVKYINPVKGLERYKARVAMAIAGGYVGGQRNRRSLSEWRTTQNDADADILPDLPTLRDRCSDLSRNNPLGAGAVSNVILKGIGQGLKMQSRIDRKVLGLTDEQAFEWEERAESEWRLFAENTECDITGHGNFYALQRLFLRSNLDKGDIFALLPYIETPRSPYGLKIQAIEAERVCNKGNKRDTETIAGGIERNRYGMPIQYHILKRHPGSNVMSKDKNEWDTVPAFSPNGRRNILHIYDQIRPGQSRGIPYLAPVIEPLKQLGRYTENELMASVISSMFTVFLRKEKSAGGIETIAANGEMGYADSGKSGEQELKMGNGLILELPEGTDITTANPGRPNDSFDPFVLSILRQIGSALQQPFEVIIKHYTSSYSAARAALLDAWCFYNQTRSYFVSAFCVPIYEVWLEEAIMKDRIIAPGFFDDFLIRSAYLGTEWIGPSPGQIDPNKEVDAASSRVSLGVSTVSEETVFLTGKDWDKKIPQIKRERAILKEIGLVQEKEDKEKNETVREDNN